MPSNNERIPESLDYSETNKKIKTYNLAQESSL